MNDLHAKWYCYTLVMYGNYFGRIWRFTMCEKLSDACQTLGHMFLFWSDRSSDIYLYTQSHRDRVLNGNIGYIQEFHLFLSQKKGTWWQYLWKYLSFLCLCFLLELGFNLYVCRAIKNQLSVNECNSVN